MDTILYHGVIHTMAGRTVSALAVQRGRIARTGADGDVLPLAGPETRLIDLEGRCVLPGFMDSHMHLLHTGESGRRVDLRGVSSPEEIVRRGRAYQAAHPLEEGEWIVGYGFDHNRFDPPELPGLEVAEAISTEHPVVLDRVCGHVGAGNRRALELAGFTRDTVIPGGELDKDERGELNGVVREAALDRLKEAMPRMDLRRVTAYIREAGKRLAAAGITGVHSDDLCAEGTDWPTLRAAFARLEAEDAVPVRLWQEWEAPTPARLAAEVLSQPLRSGQGTDWLKVINVKLIADGSLGARTAWLRADYSDAPGSRGIPVYTQAEMDEMVRLCHEANLQVACHAIGDGACASFVSAVEKAMAADPKPLRHRVVHYQFGDGDLYRRMAALGMGADIQPAFVPSDAPIVSARVGEERASSSYAWRTLLDCGVTLGGGSDSPVESFSPLWGIHCAVNRPDAAGSDTPWRPEERLTVEQAVGLYTTGPAALALAERDLGTLEAGKWADLVALDRDIFTVPAREIKDLNVMLTMVGGRITYRA